MKLSSTALGLFGGILGAQACVHTYGSITVDPLGIQTGIGAEIWDNGSVVCGGPWRIDQDDHYSATCIPGYIFAVSRTGVLAWYRTSPTSAYSWTQNVQEDSIDCYGACDDRKGMPPRQSHNVVS
ncbi:hypothetical protein GQ53DRAFT_759562 [Thozetella sp. PMI_491]|nr:hypothetical protein GQ53DRAFT_759562 [Thozetella sp. PMI_491]